MSNKNDEFEGEEEDWDWDSIEAAMIQHTQNLSFSQLNEPDESTDEEDDNVCGDSGAASKRLFEVEETTDQKPCANEDHLDLKPAAVNRVSTLNDNDDEFDDDFGGDLEEVLNMVDEVSNHGTPLKITPSSRANSLESQTSSKAGVPDIQSSSSVKTATKAKRQTTLFDAPTTGKKRKLKGSTPAHNTLTQMWSSACTERKPSSKRLSVKDKLPNGNVHVGNTLFAIGDIWQSKAQQYDGFAFQLGEMSVCDGVWKAKCNAVWMRLEKTFIGDRVERVKELTQCKYVLLKQHFHLPADGRVTLNQLSKRLETDLPNERTALRYEQPDNFNFAYYYEYTTKPIPPPPDKCPVAADFFAGAGGMSRGLEAAGFHHKYKVEWNRAACESLDLNFKDSLTFNEDISVFLDNCQNRVLDIYPSPNEIDYQHGSPPCQGFSAVNTSGGANDHQNNQCTLKYLDTINFFKSPFVTMENVLGMKQKAKIEYLLTMIEGLLASGYQVRQSILNSSDFGVPQDRKRIILFGAQKGYQFPKHPIPTHGEGKLPKVTAGDAIGDLETVSPCDSFVKLPNGAYVKDHLKQGTELGDKSTDDYRLCRDLPAYTVRKGNKMIHYNGERYATPRERARLMSFPDKHKFCGTTQEKLNQIGNAVPRK
jgi:DNA (cytosine-5)-methyltransferase 1